MTHCDAFSLLSAHTRTYVELTGKLCHEASCVTAGVPRRDVDDRSSDEQLELDLTIAHDAGRWRCPMCHGGGCRVCFGVGTVSYDPNDKTEIPY